MTKQNHSIQALLDKHVLSTYGRLPICLVKGKGSFVWDADGKKYLDFTSGLAVSNLGHSPDFVSSVLARQSQKLIHTSNLFYIKEQALLAQKLTRLTKMDKAFFCSSGAEAVEAAIKLARVYSTTQFHSQRYEIIVAQQSFHGRTMGALSATAQSKYHQGFRPLLKGFKVTRFNDLDAVAKKITSNTAAILVEPIQGEGGVHVASPAYLKGLRKLCDQKKLLLILDEVQVGSSRTGRFLASQNYGVKADIVSLAKGVASGLPMGVCLVNKRVAALINPGMHASTFGGNPLVSAVALKTVEKLAKPGFLNDVRKKGRYFLKQLEQLAAKHRLIKEVRGMGLILACELKQAHGSALVNWCLNKGLIINQIQNKIMRFLPPLTVTQKEMDQALFVFEEGLMQLKEA